MWWRSGATGSRPPHRLAAPRTVPGPETDRPAPRGQPAGCPRGVFYLAAQRTDLALGFDPHFFRDVVGMATTGSLVAGAGALGVGEIDALTRSVLANADALAVQAQSVGVLTGQLRELVLQLVEAQQRLDELRHVASTLGSSLVSDFEVSFDLSEMVSLQLTQVSRSIRQISTDMKSLAGSSGSSMGVLALGIGEILTAFNPFTRVMGAVVGIGGALVDSVFSARVEISKLSQVMNSAQDSADSYMRVISGLSGEVGVLSGALSEYSSTQILAEMARVAAEIRIQQQSVDGLREGLASTVPELDIPMFLSLVTRLGTGQEFERAGLIFAQLSRAASRFSENNYSHDEFVNLIAGISHQMGDLIDNEEFSFINEEFLQISRELSVAEQRLVSSESRFESLNSALRGTASAARDSADATHESSDATERLSEQYDSLVRRLYPAQAEIQNTIGILNEITDQLLIDSISEDEFVRLTNQAIEQFRQVGQAARDSSVQAEQALQDYMNEIDSTVGRVSSSIEGELSSALYDSLRGESLDFWQWFQDIALRTVAHVAASIARTAIIQPIVATVVGELPGVFGISAAGTSGMSGTSIPGISDVSSGLGNIFSASGALGTSVVRGDIGQFLGLSNTVGSGFFSLTSTTSFGQSLESALNDFSSPVSVLGNFAAGLALDAILGNRGIGSTIGQTIGSLAGSFLGPAGSIGGGVVGNLLGGLFGGSRRPPDSTAVFDLSFANDNFRLAGSKNPTSEQQQVLTALAQQVLGLEALLNELGGGFGSLGGVGVGLSGKYSDFVTIPGIGRIDTGTRNDIGAVEALLLEQLRPQISRLDATLMGVVSRSDASGFAALTQELSAAGTFLEQYETLVDQATLSEEEFAIKQVTERWQQLIDQAEAYELALDPLITLRDKEIAAIEAQAAALDETERARAAVMEDTLAAGRAIQDFLEGQALSDASSLSPTARLAEAQAQFGDNLDLVRGGDLGAVGALTASAANLLRFGREQFASTLSFAALETSVRSSLAQVGVDLTSEASIADRTTKAVEAQTLTLADLLEEANKELVRVRQELTAIKRDMREAA